MTEKRPVPGWAVAAGLAAGLLFSASPVGADEPAAEELEEIIIVESPIVRRIPAGRPVPGGTQSEVIELSRTVSFADLDLSKEADVAVLSERIEAVAEENCDKLDRMFRVADADRRDLRRCKRKAIESARRQLDDILTASKRDGL